MHSAMQEIALCSGCVGGKERVVEMCVVQLVANGGGVWVRWRVVGARRVWVLRERGEGT